MSDNAVYDLILGKLDNIESSQSLMGKELSTVIERMDQRDQRYCDKFSTIEKEIEKGYEGRKVLHQKQDDLDKKIEKIKPDIDGKINDLQPEITFVKTVRQHINKMIWAGIGIIILGIVLTSLPKIIEALS